MRGHQLRFWVVRAKEFEAASATASAHQAPPAPGLQHVQVSSTAYGFGVATRVQTQRPEALFRSRGSSSRKTLRRVASSGSRLVLTSSLSVRRISRRRTAAS